MNAVRILAVAATALLCCILGAIQFISSVTLRDAAVSPALVRFVPASVAERVEYASTNAPLPYALRLVLTARALDRGDLALAAKQIATLRPSDDRLALEGRLAELHGDHAQAARDYLAAGDLAGVEATVASLQRSGRSADAVTLLEDVVVRLSADRSQEDTLAQAEYELGAARQVRAYEQGPTTPEGRADATLALKAYESAATFAPLSLRYIIALGNQRLNVGDIAGAQDAFTRARDLDPTSAEPWTGLGDAAFRSGDRPRAQAMLTRARTLDPHSAAVTRLAAEIGS